MGIQATYLGMPLQIDDLDVENLAYFKHCAAHDFHLQKCSACGLLRYPPTTACPWCMSPKSQWVPVDARGAVHSYTEVHHAIQPAFKSHTPYLILLVDLDTQKGKPTEHEALRVVGNLATPDGQLAPPEMVRRVGIGTRVRMVFSDVGDGIALPQWTIEKASKRRAKRPIDGEKLPTEPVDNSVRKSSAARRTPDKSRRHSVVTRSAYKIGKNR
jgi:hypothetical protein